MGVRSYTLSTTGAPPPAPFCASMPAAPPVKPSDATDLANCVALASRLVPGRAESKGSEAKDRFAPPLRFDLVRCEEGKELNKPGNENNYHDIFCQALALAL